MKLKPLILAMTLVPGLAMASSHREAPFITTRPKVDATDFYMFTSYETGRSDFVTILANYDPLQDPGGGPNYFSLDPNAAYDINIDNNGDAKADMTFRFQFKNTFRNLTVPTGDGELAVPLINIGPISAGDQSALNRVETYSVTLLRSGSQGGPLSGSIGARKGGTSAQPVKNAATGSTSFTKPVDNIGNKSIPDYDAYAQAYMYDINIPGCSTPGRMFVGQRKDGFVVNLGEVFDLVNLNPVGARGAAANTLSGKNVTTLALELPKSCIVSGNDPVVGGWTAASQRSVRVLKPSNPAGSEGGPSRYEGRYVQVSRLGAPLVNELVIGLKDKDAFNSSKPSGDGQFLQYVTNPTLPVLLNVLYGDAAMVPHTPRNDLVAAFLTGVEGVNQPVDVTPSEELRLNTSTVPTAPADQNDLGVLGGDTAGFPNGRRPYDDVVDIELRVAEGALCGTIGSCGDQNSDPNNGNPYTDQARAAGATMATETVTGNINPNDTYLDHFPYLLPPIPGSPNGAGTNPFPPDN